MFLSPFFVIFVFPFSPSSTFLLLCLPFLHPVTSLPSFVLFLNLFSPPLFFHLHLFSFVPPFPVLSYLPITSLISPSLSFHTCKVPLQILKYVKILTLILIFSSTLFLHQEAGLLILRHCCGLSFAVPFRFLQRCLCNRCRAVHSRWLMLALKETSEGFRRICLSLSQTQTQMRSHLST